MSVCDTFQLVNEVDALRAIQGHAAVGNIRYSNHAEERMAQRNVTRGDIRRALVTATAAKATAAAWRVTGGTDLDGDVLTAVVAIDGAAVIVTVF